MAGDICRSEKVSLASSWFSINFEYIINMDFNN